jgi:hypothetical protein
LINGKIFISSFIGGGLDFGTLFFNNHDYFH